MHELSIAQNIFEIVRESVPERDHAAIRVIHVRVGEVSGVVADSLEFCFSAVTHATLLEKASLAIERVPYRVVCSSCGGESRPEPGVAHCAQCGSAGVRLVSGTELQVQEVEVLDGAEVSGER